MEINVLITSVSRKVWLVKAFKDALTNTPGVSGKVVTSDASALAAALYFGDSHFMTPYSSEPNFITEITNICKKNNINLIIPTRDGELKLFSENKKHFEKRGIKVLICNTQVIDICNDKYKFYEFMKNNNIFTPKTMLSDELDISSIKFPLIVKDRKGSGSKALYKVKTKEELKLSLFCISNPVIQEFLEGKEYTVDLLADFEGKVLTAVPRERIEVVAGESYKSKTINDHKMIDFAKRITETLGVIGPITLQFIKNNDLLKVIEINPRFGGAAMLGIKAGCNTPLILLKLVMGEKVEPQLGKFRDGIVMLRYTDDIFVSNGMLLD